jgi:hypothetical protein
MAFAIMRTAKLKGGAVSASDMHTERERETLNADAERRGENLYLRGEKGENLRQMVDEVIKQAGGKRNKTSVECVEFMMTASPEHFRKENSTEIDQKKELEFYRKCGEFMEGLEERGMVFVKAVAHRDEITPHIVAYAVPLDPKGKLNCKYHLGGRDKLSALQDEFAEIMEPLGLERGIKGSVAEHQKIKTYYGKVEMLDQAIIDRQRAAELLERQTQLLQQQNQQQDMPLAKMLKTLAPERTIETSAGLALLHRDDPTQVRAIITEDNKAFELSGKKLSNGSTIMLLTSLSGSDAETVTRGIAAKLGADAAKAATQNYGNEIALQATKSPDEKPEMRKFNQEQIAHEVRATIAPKQEIAREQGIERGMSR